MNNSGEFSTDWNIPTHVGPMLFNIIITSAFFYYSSHQSSAKHRHATYELHFIPSGSGIIATDDMEYDIVPGSFYLVKSGIYHQQKGDSINPIKRYSCKFDFEITNTPDSGFSGEEVRSFDYILTNTPFFFSKNFSALQHVINEIQNEFRQRPLGFYSKVQFLFSILFISIMREISLDTNYRFTKHPSETPLETRLSIIENFFDSSYDYKATSKELCDLIHLSSSQLNRFLKKKYSMTFKQKHIERQIEFSKDYLANTNLPIRVISEKMGYASEGNFTAFFKRIVGVSPKVFRNRSHLAPGASQDP
jgi:AraC-like DNA-binding protein